MEYEITKGLVLNKDLTQPLNLGMNQGNVICIEVGEHIPIEFEQVFIDNICEQVIKGGQLILSWAHEGQQGYGHVNCRPDWYVIEEFHKRGFLHMQNRTSEVRSVIEGHVAYLRENIFVFHKA
jgi:hypothetical protein